MWTHSFTTTQDRQLKHTKAHMETCPYSNTLISKVKMQFFSFVFLYRWEKLENLMQTMNTHTESPHLHTQSLPLCYSLRSSSVYFSEAYMVSCCSFKWRCMREQNEIPANQSCDIWMCLRQRTLLLCTLLKTHYSFVGWQEVLSSLVF